MNCKEFALKNKGKKFLYNGKVIKVVGYDKNGGCGVLISFSKGDFEEGIPIVHSLQDQTLVFFKNEYNLSDYYRFTFISLLKHRLREKENKLSKLFKKLLQY